MKTKPMLRTGIQATMIIIVFIAANIKTAEAQSFLQINSTITSDVYNIETSENDDLILSGKYKGTATFGTFSKTSKGNKNYIARISPTGKFLWVTDFDENINALSVTDSGINIITITSEKNKDSRVEKLEMTLLKYSLNGDKLSEKLICTLNGEIYDVFIKAVFDNNGNPLACFHWVGEGTTKMNNELLSKEKYGGIMYVQFDQEGNEVWRQHTEAGIDAFTDMHIEIMNFDKDNNFYVIGEFGEEGFFGSTQKNKLTTEKIHFKHPGSIALYYKGNFLMKIDENGSCEKAIHLSKYRCEYTALTVGEDGKIYLGGYYKGNNEERLRDEGDDMSQDPTPEIRGKLLDSSKIYNHSMPESSFLACLDSDLNTQWTYALSGERVNRVESVSITSNELVVTGFWKMNINDGTNAFKSVENDFPYNSEVYQQVFNLDGKHLSTIVYQGEGSEWPEHALNKHNQIVTYGCFREEIKIGSSRFTSKGKFQNAFIILPKVVTESQTTTVLPTPSNAPIGSANAFKKGDLVLANWLGKGKYYPCKVTEVNGNKVTLSYDDGSKETTTQDNLKYLKWTIGMAVDCNWYAKGKFYPASIKEINGTKITVVYGDNQSEITSAKYLRTD